MQVSVASRLYCYICMHVYTHELKPTQEGVDADEMELQAVLVCCIPHMHTQQSMCPMDV